MARRYLIIGSGVASLAAAEAIRQHDSAGEVVVIGDDPDGYYSRPGLAYTLNQSLPEQQVFPRPLKDLRELYTTRIHAHATELVPDNHEVVLQNGRRVRYDRLLLATGSVAVPADFVGGSRNGVVKLDTLEDVRGILDLTRTARSAVVVGGGIIAIELAEGLAARELTVNYFLRTDRFWSSVLDENESRMVERGLAAGGIQLHYRTMIEEALGPDDRVAAVRTKAGATLACQIIGVAIGLRARMELAQAAGLATAKGIVVNEYMETSAGDVYAAGDAAEMRIGGEEQGWFETLWPKARLQGSVAGRNMAGERVPCKRNVLYNAVRIGGIVTTTIGAIAGKHGPDALTVNGRSGEGKQERHGGVNHVRVLVGQRKIVGAIVMGDQSAARPLRQMIECELDISLIRPRLEQNPRRGVEILAQFYREWERTGVKAQP